MSAVELKERSDMLIDNIKETQCAPKVVQALSHFVHTHEM